MVSHSVPSIWQAAGLLVMAWWGDTAQAIDTPFHRSFFPLSRCRRASCSCQVSTNAVLTTTGLHFPRQRPLLPWAFPSGSVSPGTIKTAFSFSVVFPPLTSLVKTKELYPRLPDWLLQEGTRKSSVLQFGIAEYLHLVAYQHYFIIFWNLRKLLEMNKEKGLLSISI